MARMGRILLVEDDHDVRLLMEHVLYDAGHRVDAARDAARAFSLLRSHRYDLVVADAVLDDGTGMAIADEAAEHGIPALIITGHAISLSRKLHGYDYLLKPVGPEELTTEVERRLRDSRKRQPQDN